MRRVSRLKRKYSCYCSSDCGSFDLLSWSVWKDQSSGIRYRYSVLESAEMHFDALLRAHLTSSRGFFVIFFVT